MNVNDRSDLRRILVVAHNHPVRDTRSLLLQSQGYSVSSVAGDDEAIGVLDAELFDLVLIGRNFRTSVKGLDQRMREKYQGILILKIDDEFSSYPTRITGAAPIHVLTAIREMLSSEPTS